MTSSTHRIGQIVPSSNITMETEVPAMLRAREAIYPERFTFHSARMRMQKVTPEELKAMDGESLRCAVELADARVDVMGYACLVAIMSMGRGYHRQSEVKLAKAAAQSGASIPIVTSAGALIDGLKTLGASRIAIVTPYMRPLTELVVDYIEAGSDRGHRQFVPGDSLQPCSGRARPYGFNYGCRTVERRRCRSRGSFSLRSDAVSKRHPNCEDRLGLPVTSASVCTTRKMLEALKLQPVVPDAGALLESNRSF